GLTFYKRSGRQNCRAKYVVLANAVIQARHCCVVDNCGRDAVTEPQACLIDDRTQARGIERFFATVGSRDMNQGSARLLIGFPTFLSSGLPVENISSRRLMLTGAHES